MGDGEMHFSQLLIYLLGHMVKTHIKPSPSYMSCYLWIYSWGKEKEKGHLTLSFGFSGWKEKDASEITALM